MMLEKQHIKGYGAMVCEARIKDRQLGRDAAKPRKERGRRRGKSHVGQLPSGSAFYHNRDTRKLNKEAPGRYNN